MNFELRKGFMFIISSPSGAGKTTIARMLLKKDSNLTISTSYTTRTKREGEQNGKDYFFVNEAEFENLVEKNFFLEHAKVFKNYYGTPQNFVFEKLEKGTDVLFDIDWQGTEQIKKSHRKDVVSVFILPPSMLELEKRLRARNNDSNEVINHRMSKANIEISHYNTYDYVIINEDLEESLQKVYSILTAERLKRTRQNNLTYFVNNLLTERI